MRRPSGQDAGLPAGSARCAVSAAGGALGIDPFPAVKEGALAAVVAAHPDLVQPLAMPAALVADAGRAQEASVSFCHPASIDAGSLNDCAACTRFQVVGMFNW